jgi:excisionase family DNA binding protein
MYVKQMGEAKADLSSVHAFSPEEADPWAPTVVDEWLTAKEAAKYLKVKTRTLLLWARQGKIKGYQLSGLRRHVWRFRRADLDASLVVPSVRPREERRV